MSRPAPAPSPRLEHALTGIGGLDVITRGGLPKARMTLVSGTSGTGKTVLAGQFLVAGVRDHDEGGVFVTLEQTGHDLMADLDGFNWPLQRFIDDGKLAIVDASPSLQGADVVTGEHDLGGLLVRIREAVRATAGARVAIDAASVLLEAQRGPDRVRDLLRRLRHELVGLGTTSLVTLERTREDPGPVTPHGLEPFVGDAVLLLRNRHLGETRRRTMEVVKMRGCGHQQGEVPFSITARRGITVVPLGAISLDHGAFERRTTTGTSTLDALVDGGVFEGSTTLVSGPTGVGKTLLACQFAAAAPAAGERALFITYEESRDQLLAMASRIGIDVASWRSDDQVRVLAAYPASRSIDEHLVTIRELVDEFEPARLVVDSLSALRSSTPQPVFQGFHVGLNDLVKRAGITAWYNASVPLFRPGPSETGHDAEAMADNLVLLRHVERGGGVSRVLAVLKARGSKHDPTIRHVTISREGVRVGQPTTDLSNVLAGLSYGGADGPTIAERSHEGTGRGATT